MKEVIKNHLLNPKTSIIRRYRRPPQLAELIKEVENDTPEYLDLRIKINRDKFLKAAHKCTKFVGKNCK